MPYTLAYLFNSAGDLLDVAEADRPMDEAVLRFRAIQHGVGSTVYATDQFGRFDIVFQVFPAWYRCTCCASPRFITREGPRDEWQHVDDQTYAATAHAHVEFGGRDCDGPTGGSYIDRPVDEDDRYDFWSRIVAEMVYAFTLSGQLRVASDDEGRPGTATWQETTDEGSRYKEARYCTDPSCADEKSTRFDVYAEMAGY